MAWIKQSDLRDGVVSADKIDTSVATDLGALGVKVDVINESTAAAGVTVDGVLLKDSGIVVPLAGALQLRREGTGVGNVALRIGPSSTEGVEVIVFENDISPAAVETAVVTVPAGAVILAVQSNVEAALTGGGTTVTHSLGTAADPDKYGTPAADSLAQNAKIDTIPDWAVLSAVEPIVLTGTATGGAADGDTALTVGTVRVRVVYLALNSLADV